MRVNMSSNSFPNEQVTQSPAPPGPAPRLPSIDEAGQATAEYALLTGAIALILALVSAWATSTGKVGALLDAVFDGLISVAG